MDNNPPRRSRKKSCLVIKHSTRTVRPVGGQESTKVEELDIDFRVPGLSHAVLKKTEHFRVQELVKKIESHPHREALQADLQQNNVYNSFSNKSNSMIRELGNVELFELCETVPKAQCSHRLLYWNQGIVYCTCGQCLIYSESKRKFNKLRLYALSFPHYVIKKGRCHGARHGKTEEQKEYHIAWNAWKRCCKKVDSQGGHFTGIHDRFLRDPVFRESHLSIGWSEQKCKEWDELAKEDHTNKLTPEERRRYKRQWYLTLNKAGKNGPMKLRSQNIHYHDDRCCPFSACFSPPPSSETSFFVNISRSSVCVLHVPSAFWFFPRPFIDVLAKNI